MKKYLLIILILVSTHPVLGEVDLSPEKITSYTGSVEAVGEIEIAGELARIDTSGGDYLHLSVQFQTNRTSTFVTTEFATIFKFTYLTDDNIPFHTTTLEKVKFPDDKVYIIPLIEKQYTQVFMHYALIPQMTGPSLVNMTFTASVIQLPATDFSTVEDGETAQTTALNNDFSFDESKLVKFMGGTYIFLPNEIQPSVENNYTSYQLELQFKIRVTSVKGSSNTLKFWVGSNFDSARITAVGEYTMNMTVMISEFYEIRMSYYGDSLQFSLDPVTILFPDMKTLDYDIEFMGFLLIVFFMTLPISLNVLNYKKIRERYMEDQTGFSKESLPAMDKNQEQIMMD